MTSNLSVYGSASRFSLLEAVCHARPWLERRLLLHRRVVALWNLNQGSV